MYASNIRTIIYQEYTKRCKISCWNQLKNTLDPEHLQSQNLMIYGQVHEKKQSIPALWGRTPVDTWKDLGKWDGKGKQESRLAKM